MHTREYLIKNKILDDSKSFSRKMIAKFYQNQLDKFEKIGLGRTTENDTIITPELIRVTRKRLHQLEPILKITAKEK